MTLRRVVRLMPNFSMKSMIAENQLCFLKSQQQNPENSIAS
jgi:hypothetical protein